MGGPQRQSGRGGEKNFQLLPGLEPPIIQPVAQRYTTDLTRLLYYYSCFIKTCLNSSFMTAKTLQVWHLTIWILLLCLIYTNAYHLKIKEIIQKYFSSILCETHVVTASTVHVKVTGAGAAQSVQWPGYGMDDRVRFPVGPGISYLFATASKSSVGPSRPPTE
jgi:hypothetical protein